MDEEAGASDDDTVEFEIEVVTSTSSASLASNDGDRRAPSGLEEDEREPAAADRLNGRECAARPEDGATSGRKDKLEAEAQSAEGRASGESGDARQPPPRTRLIPIAVEPREIEAASRVIEGAPDEAKRESTPPPPPPFDAAEREIIPEEPADADGIGRDESLEKASQVLGEQRAAIEGSGRATNGGSSPEEAPAISANDNNIGADRAPAERELELNDLSRTDEGSLAPASAAEAAVDCAPQEQVAAGAGLEQAAVDEAGERLCVEMSFSEPPPRVLPAPGAHFEPTDSAAAAPAPERTECQLVSAPNECPRGWSLLVEADALRVESVNRLAPAGLVAGAVALPAPKRDADADKQLAGSGANMAGALSAPTEVDAFGSERAKAEEDDDEGGASADLEPDQPVDISAARAPSVDAAPTSAERDLQRAKSPSLPPPPPCAPKAPQVIIQAALASSGEEGAFTGDLEPACLSPALSLDRHDLSSNNSNDGELHEDEGEFHDSLSEQVSTRGIEEEEEEEDLEREFDEEPEFERREVSVKRNCDPRVEYELGAELGRGKFGTVFRCVERQGGRQLAAKFIAMRRREDREDVEREVAIMSVLQHKRLLQLYDAFDDGRQEMCLITELVEGGELFERIVDDDFDLTEKKAAIFMRQICEGVEYMHGQQIVHLDMKPENILCLSRTSVRIKLIDFGLARRLDPNNPTRVMFGTPDFAAPEVLGYETVTLATDMWSVGVICYVLLSGLSPFMGESDMDTMANVTRATYDFNDQAFEPISELAKDFISKLLLRNPAERLAPAECLKHAWLQRGGAQLEAAVRERRESFFAPMLLNTHRLALEQAAAAAAAAATPGALEMGAEMTPPLSASLAHQHRPSFGGESTTSSGLISLDKRRLKRYVVRRKWHKTVHAIMALNRMGARLNNKLLASE